ncbi:hypothetical protein EYF80_066504 [Liparis tanakae]|uniref:Uncharacterized protein n=1 Tax=Liparis tanakae TaxID=230148 RepID=A0A4Z2E3S9_9TELE|nr:hypothetical protein EYF80_066504 [Liparis tanakae]
MLQGGCHTHAHAHTHTHTHTRTHTHTHSADLLIPAVQLFRGASAPVPRRQLPLPGRCRAAAAFASPFSCSPLLRGCSPAARSPAAARSSLFSRLRAPPSPPAESRLLKFHTMRVWTSSTARAAISRADLERRASLRAHGVPFIFLLLLLLLPPAQAESPIR